MCDLTLQACGGGDRQQLFHLCTMALGCQEDMWWLTPMSYGHRESQHRRGAGADNPVVRECRVHIKKVTFSVCRGQNLQMPTIKQYGFEKKNILVSWF